MVTVPVNATSMIRLMSVERNLYLMLILAPMASAVKKMMAPSCK